MSTDPDNWNTFWRSIQILIYYIHSTGSIYNPIPFKSGRNMQQIWMNSLEKYLTHPNTSFWEIFVFESLDFLPQCTYHFLNEKMLFHCQVDKERTWTKNSAAPTQVSSASESFQFRKKLLLLNTGLFLTEI